MNNIFTKILKLVNDKNYRFDVFSNFGFYNNMSDIEYIKRKFESNLKYDLNLDNPQTYSEKLQWMKLYNRNPLYTSLVDKFKVRNYVKEKIGDEYLIPLVGVWNDPNEIDFDKLPEKFVLKCNHNSGLGMEICKDKRNLNISDVKKKLAKGLKENYYLKHREWPYKNVERKIIAEKYMEDNSGGLIDYKFFCFNGYVDSVMVCIDRHIKDTKFYFFNKEWNLLRINKRGKEAPENFTLSKPKRIEKMFEIASTLSEGLPFARVDLYECDDKIYFGEITFFPDGGYDGNILRETDEYLGKLIDIEEVTK